MSASGLRVVAIVALLALAAVIDAMARRRSRSRSRRALTWIAVVTPIVAVVAVVAIVVLSAWSARVAKRRASCIAEAQAKMDANDPWAALALRCGNPAIDAHARWLLGDFAAASDAFIAARRRDPDRAPELAEVEAHAFAGRWSAARATVESMSARFYGLAGSAEKETLDCVAAALAIRAGERDRSKEVTYRARNELCKLALIDVEHRSDADREGLDLLLSDSGYPRGADVVKEPARWIQRRRFALEASLLRTEGNPTLAWSPATRVEYAGAAAELAAFSAIAGDMNRAATFARTVERTEARPYPTEAHGDEWPSFLLDRWDTVLGVTGAAFALLGRKAEADSYIEHADFHAREAASHHLALIAAAHEDADLSRVWWPDSHLFAIAQESGGDGAALVADMIDRHSVPRVALVETLPLIRRHRGALISWLRDRFPAPCATCGLYPLLANVADRRALASALGDTDLERRTREVVEKLLAAALTREGAPEMIALERFFERIHDPS